MTAFVLALVLQADSAPLIEKLRAAEVEVRDAAERDLVKLGEAALPALKKALEAEKEPEPKARLASVVAKIEKPIRYAVATGAWRVDAELRMGWSCASSCG